MERSRRELLAALGSTCVVGLAGCGGSSSEPTETVDATDTTSTRTPTATLTPTPTESDVAPADERTQRLAAESGSSISFGSAIDITGDGTTSVVGDSGTAYVFDTSGGSWSQQTTLTADDGGSGFGSDVGISDDGTTVVVGANTADEPNGNSAGAAYVFTQAGGSWSQQTKLAASESSAGEEFGSGVALSGDGTTTLVGAPFYTQGDNDSGAAYVFTQSGGGWSQRATLTPAGEVDTGSGQFGDAVALAEEGNRAVVGAKYYAPNGVNSGAAYAFSQSGGSWSQEAELVPEDNADGDWFGSSVELSADGTMALVGAELDGGEINNYNVGAAYIFERSGSAWAEGAKITADDGDDLDSFGAAVSLSGSGETAVVGAPGDEDVGSAYVFTGDGGWTQDSKLTGDDNGNEDYSNDEFGAAVTVSDDGGVAIVGAPDDEDPNGDAADGSIGGAGSAYVYD